MRRRANRRIALLVFGWLSLASASWAQEQPVVFLHGLGSNSDGWLDTAAQLRAPLLIDARTPDVNWRRTYQDQANELAARPEFALFAPAPILVGHSNGGIVSREWTRSHAASGVITLGTPHRGAPLMPHILQWAAYQAMTSPLLNGVLEAFGRWTDWGWVFPYVSNALSFVSDYSIWSVFSLAATVGIDLKLPVTAQMHPYSPYLDGLNSFDNVRRESQDVPGRVGIVSIAHNFYWAGPARAIAPEAADAIAEALYGAAFGALYWGEYILIQADPMDLDATHQAYSLLNLGGFLLSIDPLYCRLVSSMNLNECIANDGVVPLTSQEYPGAPNLLIEGPAHTQERQQSYDALYQALVWYTHTPPRPAQPPPPPPVFDPEPPPSSNPGSDPSPGSDPGVGSDADSSAENTSGSAPRADSPGGSAIFAGQGLHPGESMTSDNGLYRLRYDESGDLVLFDEVGGYPMWTSGTQGTSPGIAVMQDDGNFVIYDAGGGACWSSNSDAHPGAYLVVQDDGNVVVYDTDNRPLWNTGTWR